jgi:hypothetical protein
LSCHAAMAGLANMAAAISATETSLLIRVLLICLGPRTSKCLEIYGADLARAMLHQQPE